MDRDQKISRMANMLKTLAQYHRLRILFLLDQQGSMTVSAIVTQLALEQSLTSRHLIKLRDAGILVSSRIGKENYYALSDPTLLAILTPLLTRAAKQA